MADLSSETVRAGGEVRSSNPRNTPNSTATAAASSAFASPARNNAQLALGVHYPARAVHHYRSRSKLSDVPQDRRFQRTIHRIEMDEARSTGVNPSAETIWN